MYRYNFAPTGAVLKNPKVLIWAAFFAHITDPASSVCTECHCAAHIRFTALRAHHSCAHQPSLAAYPWLERISFKLTVLTYRATHGAGPSYFQSCFTKRQSVECIPPLGMCAYPNPNLPECSQLYPEPHFKKFSAIRCDTISYLMCTQSWTGRVASLICRMELKTWKIMKRTKNKTYIAHKSADRQRNTSENIIPRANLWRRSHKNSLE